MSVYFGFEQPGISLPGTPALVLTVGGVLVKTVRRFFRLRFTTYVITDERLYCDLQLPRDERPEHPALARHARREDVKASRGARWDSGTATWARTDKEERAVDIPAIRDGPGLMREAAGALRRGANVAWLRRGD